jgi:hypothetical protein
MVFSWINARLTSSSSPKTNVARAFDHMLVGQYEPIPGKYDSSASTVIATELFGAKQYRRRLYLL